ncbi:copper chaperone PCu(A)C [Neokomagataea tanensis]|nr:MULTISPECIES: copper chaperone PCu(A)C [Neokomagataea]
MRRNRFSVWGVCVALASAVAPVYAEPPAQNNAHVVVSGGTLLPLATNSTRAAGFFSLQNSDSVDRLLKGIASPICTKIMAHHTKQEQTVATNDLFNHLAIQHNAMMVFPRDGYHLVCLGLKRPLQTGEKIPFTFSFLDSGDVTADFTVVR